MKAGYFAVMPMKAWISEWRMLYIRAVSGQNEDETIEQIISHDASPGYRPGTDSSAEKSKQEAESPKEMLSCD